MELHSPDGSTIIDAHPSKIKSLLAKGWTPDKPKKSKAKAEDKVEEKES